LLPLDRFIKLDYHRQLARIKALGTRFGVGAVVAERNAAGDPLTEQLRHDLPVPVHPFTTTAVSKRQGLDRLILAFERQEIALLRDEALIHELLAYSAKTLPSGLIQYGAPPGSHDDLVMALMLAWEGSRFRAHARAAAGAAASLWLVSGGILGDALEEEW
jgi:hypothetical protein